MEPRICRPTWPLIRLPTWPPTWDKSTWLYPTRPRILPMTSARWMCPRFPIPRPVDTAQDALDTTASDTTAPDETVADTAIPDQTPTDDQVQPGPVDPSAVGPYVVATLDATVPQGSRTVPVKAYLPQAVTGKVPMVLFFPGFQLKAADYTGLLERLASHGMVVIGADPSASLLSANHVEMAKDGKAVIDWALAQAGIVALVDPTPNWCHGPQPGRQSGHHAGLLGPPSEGPDGHRPHQRWQPADGLHL